MTPLSIAIAFHERTSPGIPFEAVLDPHIRHGIVILTPTVAVLARRTESTWTKEWLNDPDIVAPAGDSIHVWILAGRPSRSLYALIPAGIRFLTYHRGARLIRRDLFHKA